MLGLLSSPRSKSSRTPEPTLIEEKIVKINGEIGRRTYSKGRLLGKGGFAHVYEFICLETKTVTAAKFIPKTSLNKARARQKLMNEIKIHRSLHHENIVLFEHFFEDNENIYILLELCQNQTLNDMMKRRKRLTETELKYFLYQIILGMKYMHSHRVLHRDIKLGNLFLNDALQVKIGDFGLASKLEFEGERKRTICGTPNYIAPEILDGKQGHSFEVDTWSVGVLTYILAVGKPPFEADDVKSTYKRIKQNTYDFPLNLTLSEELRGFIKMILVTDPMSRPGFDDMLSHEFFTATPFPKHLPASVLAVPLSSSYIRQCSKMNSPRIQQTPKTGRAQNDESKAQTKPSKTDRLQLESPRGFPLNEAPQNKRTVSSEYTAHSEGINPSIWVKKWVDYSNKYGVGYLLSNNSVGVVFNDSTKIVMLNNSRKFLYVSRNQLSEYTTEEHPEELRKKLNILLNFRKKFTVKNEGSFEEEFIYIKKWVNSPRAVIFRLSSGVAQARFHDKTEIIICRRSRQVYYIDNNTTVWKYPVTGAAESENSEMTVRLAYTKEVLTSGVGKTGGASSRK